MPNKIPIEKIQELIPDFVKIIPETYRGVRYNADFIDTEYNEKFTANPKSVINLQHGCQTRSNKMRSETVSKHKKEFGRYGVTPIEDIITKLPPFLEIDKESYKGARYLAKFYDKEYNVWFEASPANLILKGKGYCKERIQAEFKKSITLSADEIQQRVNELYGDRVVLVKETYVNTNTACKWIIDGFRKATTLPTLMLSEAFMLRFELERWKAKVKVRDDFTCIRCNSTTKICAHHIEPWKTNKDLRFDVENGATLCNSCHHKYHSLYHRIENKNNFKVFLESFKFSQENT